MVFSSIKRRQSSSVISGVTVTSSRVMISDAFIQAGHLFSAATLSETSLCESTPTSLPFASTTPTARTCFSRRYCAARCTLVSSVMEKTSLREPMRSETFIGPSDGGFRRMVGPTHRQMQHENLEEREEGLAHQCSLSLSRIRRQAVAPSLFLCLSGFPPHNIVALDDCGHTHMRTAVLVPLLHAHDFARGPDEHLRAVCNFRGKRQ